MATPASANRTTGHWAAVAAILRSVAAGGLAGFVAGIVVAGIGGRLAMRVSALADPGAEGFVTDSGNRVGDISATGTVELLFFGGVIGGIFAGIAWVVVRPWLERLGKLRPAGAAVVGVAAGPVFVLNAENHDFAILDPAWLNVTLFLVVLALMGAATAVADSWLHEHLPRARRWNTAIYGLVVALGAPLAVPMVGNYFSRDFCGCDDPPRATGAFLVGLGVLTASSWVLTVRSRDSLLAPPRWLRISGEVALTGLVVAGLLFTVQEIRGIV